MRERRETVFPVPDGISSTQCPCTQDAQNHITPHARSMAGKVGDLGIQCAFELQHVRILLWIDVLIREHHRETID